MREQDAAGYTVTMLLFTSRSAAEAHSHLLLSGGADVSALQEILRCNFIINGLCMNMKQTADASVSGAGGGQVKPARAGLD